MKKYNFKRPIKIKNFHNSNNYRIVQSTDIFQLDLIQIFEIENMIPRIVEVSDSICYIVLLD